MCLIACLLLALMRYGVVWVEKLKKKARGRCMYAGRKLLVVPLLLISKFWCYFGAIILDTCWWLCVWNISQKTFQFVELKWSESEDEFWNFSDQVTPPNVHVFGHNILSGSWNRVLFVASKTRLLRDFCRYKTHLLTRFLQVVMNRQKWLKFLPAFIRETVLAAVCSSILPILQNEF